LVVRLRVVAVTDGAPVAASAPLFHRETVLSVAAVSTVGAAGLHWGAPDEDVDEQDCHGGGAYPHGLLPTVDEGLLGGADERVRPGSGRVGSFDGVGDAARAASAAPPGTPSSWESMASR